MSQENEGKENLIQVDVEMALNVSEYGVVGTIEIPEEWLKSFDSNPDIQKKIVDLVRAGLDNNEFDLGDMKGDYSSADGLRLLSLQRGRVRETIIEPIERNSAVLGDTFMDAIAKNAIQSKEDVDDLVSNISRWSLKGEEEIRELLEGFARSVVNIAQQEQINKSYVSSVYHAKEDGYGGLLVVRSRGGVDNASAYLQPGDDSGTLRRQLEEVDCLPDDRRERVRQDLLSQYDDVMSDIVISVDEDPIMDADSKQNNGSTGGRDDFRPS